MKNIQENKHGVEVDTGWVCVKCGKWLGSERGLNIHYGKCHKGNVKKIVIELKIQEGGEE